MATRAEERCRFSPSGAPGCHECQRSGGVYRCQEEGWLQQERLISVGRLVTEVGHDFNNLMTAVLGFAHVALEEAEPDSQVAKDLGEAILAAESAASLAAQLLSFAKPTRPPGTVTDVSEVCRDVGRMLQRLIGKGTRVHLAYPEFPIYVSMERHHLEQVLVNLILNARDAMPGGGRITVRCEATEAGTGGEVPLGCKAQIRVADTGTGIPADVMPHIFEPFFTTRAAEGGTGLGLASCKQVVTGAGGEILVRSSAQSGTEFTILLPLAERAP